MSKRARIILLLGILAVAFTIGGQVSAGVMDVDTYLRFRLGQDTAYIHTWDTLTSIPVSLYWVQSPPAGPISTAKFAVKYDTTKFRYVSTTPTVTYSTFKDSLGAAAGVRTLYVMLYGTSVTPSTTPTTFANIHFTAVGQTGDSLQFDMSILDYNKVNIPAGEKSPYAWQNGYITVNTTIYDDPNLHFTLDPDSTFNKYSSGTDSLAIVPLSIYWDANPPAGTITNLCFKFGYDDSKFIYSTTQSLISPSFTVTRKVVAGAFDTLILKTTGASLTPPTSPLTLANITFVADAQMEHTTSTLDFSRTFDSTRVITSTGNTYSPGLNSSNYHNGWVKVSDYSASFRVDTVSGYLGAMVYVPVYGTSNSRLSEFDHTIKFDTTQLHFEGDTVNLSLFPGGVHPNYDHSTVGHDTVYAHLLHHTELVHGCLYFTSEMTSPQWIYKLKFKIKNTATPNSQTALNLLSGSTAGVSGLGSPCLYYPWVEAVGLTSGAVVIPKDTAVFWSAVSDASRKISKGGNNVGIGFSVKIKSGFPAGTAATIGIDSCIRVDYDFGTHWKYYSLTENGLLHFHRNECGTTDLSDEFWQKDTSSVSNWVNASTSYTEMFGLGLNFDTTGYAPTTYLGRYVKPSLAGSGCNGPARVKDTTGHITATTSNSKLTLISDSVEVAVGEFAASSANFGASSYYVSDTFYVRNNFALDTFSVKINVSQNHNITSVQVLDTTKVRADYVSSKVYHIYSKPGFSYLAPNGNNYTALAKINYVTVGRCMKQGQGYTTSYVTFSERLMKDTAHLEQYTVEADGLIGSKCDYFLPPDTIIEEGLLERNAAVPTQFMLYPNRPNPFNPSTTINYDLAENSAVVLEIYNILGERVNTLVDSYQPAGRYEIVWNGRDVNGRNVASGIYLYRLRAGSFIATKKMSLIK